MTPHIASDRIVSEAKGRTYQPCVRCGEPLVSRATDDWQAPLVLYATGECVGEGCAKTSPLFEDGEK